MKSKCCAEGGFQCYSMNKHYGQCLKSCSSYVKFGPNKPLLNKEGKPWECKKYGQRHPRKWGWPSLFCFSVFRLNTYEGDIIKNQLSKGIGIFACEESSILSQDAEVVVGEVHRTLRLCPRGRQLGRNRREHRPLPERP